MDNLIVVIILGICHWIKCKFYVILYTSRGKKNMSFVDHAIALAYECEYEGQKNRDKNGKGEVILDTGVGGIISVHSNNKGSYSISVLDAFVANRQFYQVLEDLCKVFNQNSDGIAYSVIEKDASNLCISITSEIEADPTEKDARYYITGYTESVFPEKKQQLVRAFHKYKAKHPDCQYDAINSNI